MKLYRRPQADFKLRHYRGRVLTGIRGTWVIGSASEDGRSFAKAMLVSGAPNEDFAKRVGHRLEIVPQTDPFELPPDGSLRIQALLNSKPLPAAFSAVSG